MGLERKAIVSTKALTCLSKQEVVLSHLDGVVSLGEVGLLLLLLLGDDALLLLGEGSPQSAGLLRAEVKRKVLLALVEDAELRALVDVDDGEDTGDRLADVVTITKRPSELMILF